MYMQILFHVVLHMTFFFCQEMTPDLADCHVSFGLLSDPEKSIAMKLYIVEIGANKIHLKQVHSWFPTYEKS